MTRWIRLANKIVYVNYTKHNERYLDWSNECRWMVFAMLVQNGVTPTELSKLLGVHRKTIDNSIRNVRFIKEYELLLSMFKSELNKL